MAHCININNKQLQALSKNLDINPQTLVGAVQEWQNINNVDSFPSEQYLSRYFKLQGESNTQYSSLEHFRDALKLWENEYSSPKKFNNSEHALTQFNDAVDLFGKDNVSLIPRLDDTYDLNVLKPTKNIVGNPFDSVLHTQLEEKLKSLYPQLQLKYQNNPIQGDYKIGESIIGQADLQAMTILIDAVNQKQDTLPHEYAHHYIAWYRESPIVQRAIKKYGTEENLVQAIGEQVAIQKGELNSWWRRFFNWIKLQFAKIDPNELQTLTNYITDSFLQAKDLGNYSSEVSGVEYQTLDERRSEFYNSKILKATDRKYLADQAVSLFSDIIDQLQGKSDVMSSERAKEFYFVDGITELENVDFSEMTRQEIINTLSPRKIFDFVRDFYFDPFERTDIQDESILAELEVAYDHFYEMLNASYNRLISAENITLNENTTDWANDDVNDQLKDLVERIEEGVADRESWQRDWRHISIRESLSPLVKRELDKIRRRDANGEFVRDKYRLIEIVDSDVVYATILDNIHTGLDINQMENMLESLQTNNPWVQDVLELIKHEPFRSQFFQNFRKDLNVYSMVFRETDADGNYVYKTKIINTRDLNASVVEDAQLALKTNELGMMERVDPITGVGRINTTMVTGVRNTAADLIKIFDDNVNERFTQEDLTNFANKHTSEVSALLNKLGIQINDIALNGLLAHTNSRAKNFYKDSSTGYNLLKQIFGIADAMNNVAVDPAKDASNYDMFGKGEDSVGGYYKNLARVMSRVLESTVESSTYENGKLYYAYSVPSYLGKLMLNLKNVADNPVAFQEFMQNEYLQYGWFQGQDFDGSNIIYNSWLRELSQMNTLGRNSRNLFSHKIQLHHNKTEYSDLGALGYATTLIHEFFSDFYNANYAWYHLPTLSDKPSSEFIKYKRHTNKNTVDGYKTHIIDELINLAKQEVKRIKTVVERANINAEKYRNYDVKLSEKMLNRLEQGKKITIQDILPLGNDAGGAMFRFLDFLNPMLLDSEASGHTDLINYIQGNDFNAINLVESFRERITEGMESKFQEALDTWEKIGLFAQEHNPKTNREHFIYLNQLGQDRTTVEENLRNYFYNSYLATSNIIQLTVTDIAYFKNAEDFQKRYAQIHSPGLRLNIYATDINGERYSKDGIEKTMYIQDLEIASELSESIGRIFDRKIENAKDENQKKGYKKLKKNVLEAFTDINVTDGQAFTSITGYRKKMGMAGRFTDAMVQAYEKIKNNDWTLADMNVVWQPLKPFVFSQITKPSYAKAIETLKVPMQNKNSEYLLLIAAALAQGDPQNNKLKALVDFMEDNDIDTIQFNSAVKVGEVGVININDVNTYQETYDILQEHLYEKDAEGATVMVDGIAKFNDQYVHQIPFEDYSIQQEVPESLTDAHQLFGTQIRKLIIADITPGTLFKIGNDANPISKDALIKEYQDIIATNVQESYDNLIEDLQLDNSDQAEKNKAISEILTDEVRKNARYGPDMLRAVSLNENGDFNIPLSDPTHSYRIQQLFNSIIKNRLTKQEIKGGSTVQVAPYGLHENLEIVFNDDGSIKHFEAYMPIPSESWKELLLDADENGQEFYNIDKVDEKGNKVFPENLREMVGYRIPTEDKYSMIPIYIKGFLAEQSGNGLMLPQEITLISGADFDIDKIFVMRPEYRLRKRTNKSQFLREFRKTLDEKVSYNDLDVAYSLAVVRDGMDGLSEGSLEQKMHTYYNEQYKDSKEYTSIEKIQYDNNKTPSENSLKARNNRLIDIITSVLTNIDTADKIFNPGSFDVQKKSSRIITIAKSDLNYTYDELQKMSLAQINKIIEDNALLGYHDLLTPITQVYFQQQNSVAKQLIGIFANHNTSHAMLQLQNINLNLENDIIFDGTSFNSITDNTNEGTKKSNAPAKLDNMYSLDGVTLISKNIAGYLAASADGAKDPVLNFMNLNTFTANTAMLLIRLGFDTDGVGLFLTQPIIERVTQEYLRQSNEGYVSGETVLDNMITELSDELGGHITEESRKKHLHTTDFSKKNMYDMIKADPNTIKAKEFALDALILYKQLYEIAQDLNTLSFITKFDASSNAVGPSIAHTLAMKLRVDRFMQKQHSKFKAPPFGKDTYQVIENSPIIKAFYELNQMASEEVFSPHFPHFEQDVVTMLDLLMNDLQGETSPELVNQIINEFLAFKLTRQTSNDANSAVFNSSLENRQRFLLHFPQQFNNEIVRNEDFKDNDLAKIMRLKAPDTKSPFVSLSAQTGNLSANALEKVKNAWSDLSSNPETSETAADLLRYDFFRNAFNYGPNSIAHAAPIEAKYNMPNYIESLRRGAHPNIFNHLDMSEIKEFIIQYKRNHHYNNRLVPVVNSENLEFLSMSEGQIMISENSKSIAEIQTQNGRAYQSVIKIQTTDKSGNTVESLWINMDPNNRQTQYMQTTFLGVRNGAVEYSAQPMDVVKSAIGQNNQARTVEVGEQAEVTHDQAKKSLSSEHLALADNIIMKVMDMTSEEVNEILKDRKSKQSKVNGLLRAVVPGFLNMEKSTQRAMTEHFQKITLRDVTGEVIC